MCVCTCHDAIALLAARAIVLSGLGNLKDVAHPTIVAYSNKAMVARFAFNGTLYGAHACRCIIFGCAAVDTFLATKSSALGTIGTATSLATRPMPDSDFRDSPASLLIYTRHKVSCLYACDKATFSVYAVYHIESSGLAHFFCTGV